MSKSISINKRLRILERDNYTCQICGKKVKGIDSQTYDDDSHNIDHIIPKSKGGTDSYDNLRVLCRKCNLSRHNTSFNDFEKIFINKYHINFSDYKISLMDRDYRKEIVL